MIFSVSTSGVGEHVQSDMLNRLRSSVIIFQCVIVSVRLSRS